MWIGLKGDNFAIHILLSLYWIVICPQLNIGMLSIDLFFTVCYHLLLSSSPKVLVALGLSSCKLLPLSHAKPHHRHNFTWSIYYCLLPLIIIFFLQSSWCLYRLCSCCSRFITSCHFLMQYDLTKSWFLRIFHAKIIFLLNWFHSNDSRQSEFHQNLCLYKHI